MSLRLSHLTGSRSGNIENFVRRSVIIGRGGGNDLAFDPFEDVVVSAQHAEIREEQGAFILYDMGSLNGTYLNGFPVRRAELRTGDEIGLGKKGPRLLFDYDPGESHQRPSVVPMKVQAGASVDQQDRPRPSERKPKVESGSTQAEFKVQEIDVWAARQLFLYLGMLGLAIALGFLLWWILR